MSNQCRNSSYRPIQRSYSSSSVLSDIRKPGFHISLRHDLVWFWINLIWFSRLKNYSDVKTKLTWPRLIITHYATATGNKCQYIFYTKKLNYKSTSSPRRLPFRSSRENKIRNHGSSNNQVNYPMWWQHSLFVRIGTRPWICMLNLSLCVFVILP